MVVGTNVHPLLMGANMHFLKGARTCTILIGHERALGAAMKIQTASDLGALVRDRRGARGLSQQALALRAGVSVRWLKAFEAGKSTAEIGLVLRTLGALDLALSVVDAPGPSAVDLDDVLARFDQDST